MCSLDIKHLTLIPIYICIELATRVDLSKNDGKQNKWWTYGHENITDIIVLRFNGFITITVT